MSEDAPRKVAWPPMVVAMLAYASCATFGTPSERVSQLETQAASCTEFEDFDSRAQAVLEDAERSSPDLIELNRRVAEARRSCARSVLGSLLELRINRGAEAVQHVLEVMALAFSEQVFSSLMTQATADPNLRAMAALASATAATVRAHQGTALREQRMLDAWHVDGGVTRVEVGDDQTELAQVSQCERLAPDPALDCLVQLGFHQLDAVGIRVQTVGLQAAKKRARALQHLSLAQRAEPLAALDEKLRQLGIGEGLAQELEQARAAVWPSVVWAKGNGRIEEAAMLAHPFRSLIHWKSEVEALREAAATKQLELARRAQKPWAAMLHRRLAVRFGGPSFEWPMVAGQWDTSRAQCASGALPSTQGLELKLVAKCTRSKRESDGVQQADQKLQTFEGERNLEWENITGTLFASCLGRVFAYPVSSHELALGSNADSDLETGLPSPLRLELENRIAKAVADCRSVRREVALAECARLADGELFELEDRFTENAQALKQWPACFVTWFEGRTGVPLPAL